jgi:hypothetical protein
MTNRSKQTPAPPSDADILNIEIEIGVAAQQFLDSELGLTVQSRQLVEIQELQAKYEDLDTPVEDLHGIRLEINCRRRALNWLIDCINQAQVAHQQLQQRDAEE